jgi:hypothetical protein
VINETDLEALSPGYLEWLNEIENYSTRCERLYEEFTEVKDLKKLRVWLEAAYKVGYQNGYIEGYWSNK